MAACRRCGEVHAKCTGHNRAGKACGRPPSPGQKVCTNHGASSPQAKAAVATREVEARAERALRERWAAGEEVKTTDPLGELARVAGEIVAFKDFLRGEVHDLDGKITQEWSDKQVHMMTAEGMREYAVIKEDMRAVVQAYERALDRAAKTLANIVKLDLAGKLLEQNTEQAERIADAVVGALSGVDMPAEIRQGAMAAVADAIAALSSTGPAIVRGELTA